MSMSLFAPVPPADGWLREGARRALTEAERGFWTALERAAIARAQWSTARTVAAMDRPAGMSFIDVDRDLSDAERHRIDLRLSRFRQALRLAAEAWFAFYTEAYPELPTTSVDLTDYHDRLLIDRSTAITQVVTARISRARRNAR
ncbi:hypothetical protein [Kitasatospora sp. NPDC086791]|uniref:hypothetical protein n=1 Tax=Kitasatospora sp. NPDC086791 TaxID=3155178 RepID=UPI0034338497